MQYTEWHHIKTYSICKYHCQLCSTLTFSWWKIVFQNVKWNLRKFTKTPLCTIKQSHEFKSEPGVNEMRLLDFRTNTSYIIEFCNEIGNKMFFHNCSKYRNSFLPSIVVCAFSQYQLKWNHHFSKIMIRHRRMLHWPKGRGFAEITNERKNVWFGVAGFLKIQLQIGQSDARGRAKKNAEWKK